MKTISKTIRIITTFITAAVLLFALAACGNSGKNGNTPKNQEELEGTWEKVMSDGVEKIMIFSDGRYVSDISLNGGTSSHNDRTYEYKDGKLTVHYPDLGTDSSYKVQIKDDQLILDKDGTITVYTKK